MKLAFASIAFALATSLALVNASAIQIAPRGQPQGCAGGEVLEESTINHNGNTIQHASVACPGNSAAKRSTLEARQSVCTTGGCTITCKDLSTSDIYLSDCQAIVNLLDAYAPGSFTLAGGVYAYWTYGTCAVTITNDDTTSYKICYDTVASDTVATVNQCIGKTAGAYCTASQAAGQKWVIAIS